MLFATPAQAGVNQFDGPISQSVVNTDLITGLVNGSYNAGIYRYGTFHLIGSAGISSGAISFEQSGNGVNFVAMPVYDSTGAVVSFTGVFNVTANSSRLYSINIQAPFVRIRVSTGIVGGTVQVYNTFGETSAPFWFYPINSASSLLLGDFGVEYRANSTGAAAIFSIIAPAIPAATAIKTSAGRMVSYDLQNSSATVKSFKCWNLAVANVTLGTTSALFEIDIPAGGNSQGSLEGGLSFSVAITCAVTGAKGLFDNTVVVFADVSGFVAYQ